MSADEQLQTFENPLEGLEPRNNREEKDPPTSGNPAAKHITLLPPEIHLLIFDRLSPVQSTCFGLTNKQFYALHRAKHGTIPIDTWDKGLYWDYSKIDVPLSGLLREFMGKGGWFCFVLDDPFIREEGAGKERKVRFLTRERIEVLVEERRMREMERKGLVRRLFAQFKRAEVRRG